MKGRRPMMPEATKDLERSELSPEPELLLVTQVCEKSFVCLAVFVLHDGGRDKKTILCGVRCRYIFKPRSPNGISMVHFTATEARRVIGSDSFVNAFTTKPHLCRRSFKPPTFYSRCLQIMSEIFC